MKNPILSNYYMKNGNYLQKFNMQPFFMFDINQK